MNSELQKSRELVSIQIESGNLEAAELALNSTQLDHQSDEFKYWLSRCRFRSDSWADAILLMKEGGINWIDSPQPLFDWCHELEKQNLPELEFELYELIADEFGGDTASKAQFHLARLCRLHGKKEKAIDHFFEAIREGDFTEVLSLFYGFRSADEKKKLLEFAPRVKKLLADPKRNQRHLCMVLAQIYRANQNWDESAGYIGRARDLHRWKGQFFKEGPVAPPSFLIVGTPKSGTTALYSSLIKHPKIYGAYRKEIHFFDQGIGNLPWYLAHFPRIPKSENGITGEASPNYLYFDIGKQIKELFPEIKFVCILRNPTERVISHYFHARRHGSTNKPLQEFADTGPVHELVRLPIEQQIESVFDLFANRKNQKMNTTIPGGLYHLFLRHWVEMVGRDQILILNFESFRENSRKTLNQVCSFLNVDEFDFAEKGNQYKGQYDPSDESLGPVRESLNEFFEGPNQILEDEFGIRFSPT